MLIKFKIAKTVFNVEATTATVTFNGKTFDAIYPSTSLNGWGLLIGWGNSPLFFPNLSPVIGTYKRASNGHLVQMQVVVNAKTGQIVSEVDSGQKGIYYLQEITKTKKMPGTTLLK